MIEYTYIHKEEVEDSAFVNSSGSIDPFQDNITLFGVKSYRINSSNCTRKGEDIQKIFFDKKIKCDHIRSYT